METARDKFTKGCCVRLSALGAEMFLYGPRGARTGVVVGFGRKLITSVRVLRDGHRNATSYHMDFWEPDEPGGMRRLELNNRDIADERGIGAEQNRARAFVFGVRSVVPRALENFIDWAVLENPLWSGAILASGGRKPGTERKRGRTRGSWHGWVGGETYRHALEVQGLPPDFLEGDTFTAKGKFRMVGNGVPLPMGRAIARAVKQAIAERAA